MFNLYNPQFNPFGLDISTLSLKMVSLEKSKGKYKLVSYGRKEISEGLIKDGQITNQEKLVKDIKSLISNVNGEPIKTKYVVCSLPEEKSFVRVLRMEQMSSKELNEAIIKEAEVNIPLPLDKVYISWQVVPFSLKDGKFEVIIAASPKYLVESYIDVLKKADLIPVSLEMESLANIKSIISEQEQKKARIILDLGATRTALVVYGNYAPRFTTNLPIHCKTFEEELKKSLKIKDDKDARNLIGECGLDSSKRKGKVFNVLSSIVIELKKYLEKYIDFYEKELNSNQNIKEIILVGGGSQIRGIVPFLSMQLKRKVLLGNPWVNINAFDLKNKRIPSLSKVNSSLYSTAIGLAMYKGTVTECHFDCKS